MAGDLPAGVVGDPVLHRIGCATETKRLPTSGCGIPSNSIPMSSADAAAGSPCPQQQLQSPSQCPMTPCSQSEALPRHWTPVPELWPLTGSSANSDECSCGSPDAVESPVALETAEMEKLQYEWQFEILNHFPRDRAIDLVGYLQSVELKRSQEAGRAAHLTTKVRKLKDQLRKRESEPSKSDWGDSKRCLAYFERCLHLTILIKVIAVACLFSFPQSTLLTTPRPLNASAPFHLGEVIGTMPSEDSESCLLSDQSLEEVKLKLQMCETEMQANAIDEKDLNLHELSRDRVRHIMSEYDVMKSQFRLLQNDIDTAVDNGRSHVCWPVT